VVDGGIMSEHILLREAFVDYFEVRMKMMPEIALSKIRN